MEFTNPAQNTLDKIPQNKPDAKHITALIKENGDWKDPQ